jgi:Domain of unknown function (DUF4455)
LSEDFNIFGMVNVHLQEYEETKFLVENLSDFAAPSKLVTGISQRLHDRQRAFFHDQQRELLTILEKIGRESEILISGTIKTLQAAIESNGNLIEFHLTECDPRISLANLTLLTFHQVFAEIERNFADRRGYITKAQVEVETMEKSRKKAIAEVFETFLPKMNENSHLLAPEVDRIMKQELLTTNQMILRNRLAYANFFERLMVEAVMKGKQSREKLKLNQAEWKEIQLAKALQAARERLESCCCLRNDEVAAVAENILEDQRSLLWTRAAIMRELELTVPPGVSVEQCRDWLKRVEEVTQDLYETALEGP